MVVNKLVPNLLEGLGFRVWGLGFGVENGCEQAGSEPARGHRAG